MKLRKICIVSFFALFYLIALQSDLFGSSLTVLAKGRKTGNPIEAFRVFVERDSTIASRKKVDQSNGKIVFKNVSPGSAKIYVNASDYALSTPKHIFLPAASTKTITFLLTKGDPLYGRVIAKDSGDPIENAIIHEKYSQKHKTDGNGKFTYPHWSGRPIYVRHKDYANSSIFPAIPPKIISGSGKEQRRIAISLKEGKNVEIKISDATGSVGNMLLQGPFQTTFTFSNPEFSASHLPAGKYWLTLIDNKEKHVQYKWSFSVNNRADTQKVWRFPRGRASIDAPILRNREPEKDTKITLTIISYSGDEHRKNLQIHTRTNPNGKLQLAGIPAGLYLMDVNGQEYTASFVVQLKGNSLFQNSINIGSKQLKGSVRGTRAPSGTTIDLVRKNNVDLKTLKEKLKQKDIELRNFVSTASAGGDGKFEQKGVPEGIYSLEARNENVFGIKNNIRVSNVDNSPVSVHMQKAGFALQGLILQEDGEPLRNASVGIVQADTKNTYITKSTTTNNFGKFRIQQIPTGRYVVVVNSKAGERHSFGPIRTNESREDPLILTFPKEN